jgi:hypothetical protein
VTQCLFRIEQTHTVGTGKPRRHAARLQSSPHTHSQCKNTFNVPVARRTCQGAAAAVCADGGSTHGHETQAPTPSRPGPASHCFPWLPQNKRATKRHTSTSTTCSNNVLEGLRLGGRKSSQGGGGAACARRASDSRTIHCLLIAGRAAPRPQAHLGPLMREGRAAASCCRCVGRRRRRCCCRALAMPPAAAAARLLTGSRRCGR